MTIPHMTQPIDKVRAEFEANETVQIEDYCPEIKRQIFARNGDMYGEALTRVKWKVWQGAWQASRTAALNEAIEILKQQGQTLDKQATRIAELEKPACTYTLCADDSPTPNTLESGCAGAMMWYLGDDGKGDAPRFCHHCGGVVNVGISQ